MFIHSLFLSITHFTHAFYRLTNSHYSLTVLTHFAAPSLISFPLHFVFPFIPFTISFTTPVSLLNYSHTVIHSLTYSLHSQFTYSLCSNTHNRDFLLSHFTHGLMYRSIHSCCSLILVIRSVSDVLRVQSRFVNLWGVRPQAEPPTHFTNLLWVGSTSETYLITNLSRWQPLFSR